MSTDIQAMQSRIRSLQYATITHDPLQHEPEYDSTQTLKRGSDTGALMQRIRAIETRLVALTTPASCQQQPCQRQLQ